MAFDSTGFIVGEWRAPGEGRARVCRLTVSDDGDATLTAGDEVFAVAPFSLLIISDRVGSIPRHVGFPDGSDFETAENDAIDALRKRFVGQRAGAIHEIERYRPRLILFVIAVIALSVALYRYAVPALVEVAIWATPPVATKLMSQSVLTSLDGTLLAPTELSAERPAKLTEAFRQMTALTGRNAPAERGTPAYTLNFRKGDALGPNAFALPDGTIVLTDELVAFADDDQVVLGVLAHEIGHVVHEHSLRQLYRAAGVAGLIMLIGGDIGSGTEDVLIQGAALLSLSYSRGAEREADRYSVELMHKAGHDPAAIARFFELLRDRLGDASEADFLSTHPATPERIEETREYAKQVSGSAN